jgi:hypothetical protein
MQSTFPFTASPGRPGCPVALSARVTALNFSPILVIRFCLNAGQASQQSGHNLNQTHCFQGFFRLAPLLLNPLATLAQAKLRAE